MGRKVHIHIPYLSGDFDVFSGILRDKMGILIALSYIHQSAFSLDAER